MSFKNAKEKAKQRKITDCLRTAAKKEQILEGFQCPHKRCMYIVKLEAFKTDDGKCGRCGASVEEFTPLYVDHRKITAADTEIIPVSKYKLKQQ